VSVARVGSGLVLLAFLGAVSTCTPPITSAKSSRVLSTSDGAYEVTTCRGVNQAGVHCASGSERRFQGALVCKLDSRPWPEQPSPELCNWLPAGCKDVAPGIGSSSAAHPRCAHEDPDCGPLSYDGPACLEETGYAWNGPRKPVHPAGGGECGHDGDCVLTNERESCESRFRLDGERMFRGSGTRIGREWRRTYCGCIEGQCGYFRQ
jgi:hypothetical protein